jgi:hypothetical protein
MQDRHSTGPQLTSTVSRKRSASKEFRQMIFDENEKPEAVVDKKSEELIREFQSHYEDCRNPSKYLRNCREP